MAPELQRALNSERDSRPDKGNEPQKSSPARWKLCFCNDAIAGLDRREDCRAPVPMCTWLGNRDGFGKGDTIEEVCGNEAARDERRGDLQVAGQDS